jgi:prophage regulatory protein
MSANILRLRALTARIGLSRSTIYERMAAGKFPTPISLGGRAVGWLESEIDDWLNHQIDQSRQAQRQEG